MKYERKIRKIEIGRIIDRETDIALEREVQGRWNSQMRGFSLNVKLYLSFFISASKPRSAIIAVVIIGLVYWLKYALERRMKHSQQTLYINFNNMILDRMWRAVVTQILFCVMCVIVCPKIALMRPRFCCWADKKEEREEGKKRRWWWWLFK